MAFHPGTDAGNDWDDVVWYSEESGAHNLVALNVTNGTELQRVSNVIYKNYSFTISPGRMSIYKSPDGQRNIMALINLSSNTVFFLQLGTDGKFTSNPPVAFSAYNFGSQILRSINLSSNNWGIDGTTAWVVTDGGAGGCEGGQHCGFMNTLKINYVNNNPINAEYLASYWTGRGSDNSFVNLNNIQAQNGYIDLFTMEKWNGTYGIRRFKPGIDLISQSNTPFCTETNSMSITVRLSNPCKMRVTAEYSYQNGAWVQKPFSINGINPSNGMYTLPSGTTVLNIYVNIGAMTSGDSPTNNVRITMNMAPQDEDPNSYNSNKIVSQVVAATGTCYGGNGCPYVYVNDGDSLREDNNILERSEFTDFSNSDIVDKYKLNIQPKFSDSDNTCTLQIKELGSDHSNFINSSLKQLTTQSVPKLVLQRIMILYFISHN